MNKKVIIFGGSSGLGLEIAKIFGLNKNQIILISSDEKKLISANKELNNLNILSDYFKCDLSLVGEVDSVCEYIKEISSSIELIIFSSAKGYFGKFSDLNILDIENNFKINALSFIKILNKSIKYNNNIRYIYISSYASKIPIHNMSVYSSSKIILDKIFEVLKLEYEKGKFLTVYPGPMNTDFDKNALIENNTTFRKAKKKNSPNLIATKIYRYYKKRKETLEINSIFINLIFIFKILFSNLFNMFLRFFK